MSSLARGAVSGQHTHMQQNMLLENMIDWSLVEWTLRQRGAEPCEELIESSEGNDSMILQEFRSRFENSFEDAESTSDRAT